MICYNNAMNALIAMSGGVDSTVAASLIQNEGYALTGITMILEGSEKENALKAKNACDRLGVRHEIRDYSNLFKEKVIQPFAKAYSEGLTPNPCLMCNRYLKFGVLWEEAVKLSCDKLVTGHYARVASENGHYLLKKGLYPEKDQSYFLYFLKEEDLSHILFPLGNLTKDEVRELARQKEFENASSKDSQDICFVPNGDYALVVKEYTDKGCESGNFVLNDGTILGKHNGIINYTIGQRKGLGISYSSPLYVQSICRETNEVILGDNEALFKTEVNVRNLSFVNGFPKESEIRCSAKIRYRHPEEPATVKITDADSALVIFDNPQRAVTPGQACVFYYSDTVLGGGIIY